MDFDEIGELNLAVPDDGDPSESASPRCRISTERYRPLGAGEAPSKLLRIFFLRAGWFLRSAAKFFFSTLRLFPGFEDFLKMRKELFAIVQSNMETQDQQMKNDHRPLIPNTFGIEVRCEQFCEYESVGELKALLGDLVGRRWFQMGGGSNLLFLHDFPGTILHSRILGIEETARSADEVILKVGSGVKWDDLVDHCVRHDFFGLENLSLIPGEVGASAVQNIGAYGEEVGKYIEKVEALEVSTGEIRTFVPEECRYAYRSSIFKHELRGQFIVTCVHFRLSLKFVPNLTYGGLRKELESCGRNLSMVTAHDVRELVIKVRRAKLPEPPTWGQVLKAENSQGHLGSAGSFFMNPVVSQAKFEELLKDFPEMPHFPADGGVKITAGRLIELCGWKGRKLGHAGVFEKQALVLVNYGGATGADIVRLSQAVQADVWKKFGIEIHPEVNFIE